MTKDSRLSFALLVLFVASGFAGLIYQSVWTHYLGLTLGHAAYAQTLVLAIFMGGMAVGAWLASRYSLRWKRLILGYAIVEGLIGLFGLIFHPLFVTYTGVSQESVLPALGNPSLAHAYQWLSAALMITPQSVLLGATFPLMSAGLMRAVPNQQGEILGGLYFSNGIGAALGALLATFLLLPAVGLPGTVMTAGLLNILVALAAWTVSKMVREEDHEPIHATPAVAQQPDAQPASAAEVIRLGRVLMWATAVSGAASFVYEVGWVRLLNQALGSTIHSFELMLAAFILGLAFGGLWIRKRARSIVDPVRYVGYVQVWMAIAALISIPIFTQSFRWVEWILSALARTSNGYTLYELATAAIALLVMFPAAFLAGMTLPLFTLALLRAGAGERSIGRIYAANTLGAIVGVAAMMHLLIPLIGVRLGVTVGALIDGLVGLYLLRAISPARLTRGVGIAAFAMLAAFAFSVQLGRPDPLAQASGVFRTGKTVLAGAKVDFLRDGKTATVALFSQPDNSKSIATNGKPDASLTPMQLPPTADEITMVMAGVLPLALHPAPKRIAVIGWGSGLTTHTLLGSGVPEVVDTIEIEGTMIDGAKLFGERVERAYSDPRSSPRVDDARTFFSTGARKYDAIISEPSNPWVSGVASLFTREFYAFLRRHLNEGGMLVQWLHLYEIDDALVGTMLAALVAEFPHAEIYITNGSDLLIVGRTTARKHVASSWAPPDSDLLAELRRVGIDTPDLVALRRIGSGEVIRNFVRMTGAIPHSDYFPTVSLRAPRTRFMNSASSFLPGLISNGMPVLDILDCRVPLARGSDLPHARWSTIGRAREQAIVVADAVGSDRTAQGARDEFQAVVTSTRGFLAASRELSAHPESLRSWSEQLAGFARVTIGHLPTQDLHPIWIAPSWLPLAAGEIPGVQPIMAAYSAAAQRSPQGMLAFAEQVLAVPAQTLSPHLREQMLVIAMLGALGTNATAEVARLDAQWGPTLKGAGELSKIRSYLLAWADGGVPACAALNAKTPPSPQNG